jgi:hypothetical protein
VSNSPIFRYVKPVAPFMSRIVRASQPVPFTTQTFNGTEHTMQPMNLAMFDVIHSSGVILPREQGYQPLYWFEGNTLKVRFSGSYTIRIFDNILPFESTLIEVISGNHMSDDGKHFNSAVSFWPQVMYQGSFGVARVSNCGRNLSFASSEKGSTSIGYRLINVFGQVTEPACINVQVI